jgi:(p)ppGpp synthase/HD superfamily hydrolase
MNLDRAIQIASKAHSGQTDKAGLPYILHPIAVMMQMSNDLERQVAMLHDVIEDTPVTIDELKREGFTQPVINALECLTRGEGEPYMNYVARAAVNTIARKVKMADLRHNMSVDRMVHLNDEEIGRFKKYHKALNYLLERA